MEFLKVPNLLVLALLSRLTLIIGAQFILTETLKSIEFAGVGSAAEFGFDYRSLPCITGDFLKVLNLRALALPSRLALIIGAWLVLWWIF